MSRAAVVVELRAHCAVLSTRTLRALLDAERTFAKGCEARGFGQDERRKAAISSAVIRAELRGRKSFRLRKCQGWGDYSC